MIGVVTFGLLHLSTYVFDLLGYRLIPDYETSGTAGILGGVNMISLIAMVIFAAVAEARRWQGK